MHKGKLHSKTISSDLIDFFSVESNADVEGPRLKFEREDGQTDSGKHGLCERLWRQWCHLAIMQDHVTQAIRNVQPESVCRWPAVVNAWSNRHAGWQPKRPFCAILFYASPRVTKACETRLQTICTMTSCSIPEHPSRPFMDQTVWEHSGGLVGRAAK